MAWSEAARQAAAMARQTAAKKHGVGSAGHQARLSQETALQKEYRLASAEKRARMDKNIAMNTSPHGYADAIHRARDAEIHGRNPATGNVRLRFSGRYMPTDSRAVRLKDGK